MDKKDFFTYLVGTPLSFVMLLAGTILVIWLFTVMPFIPWVILPVVGITVLVFAYNG